MIAVYFIVLRTLDYSVEFLIVHIFQTEFSRNEVTMLGKKRKIVILLLAFLIIDVSRLFEKKIVIS